MDTWYVIRDGSVFFKGFEGANPVWTADIDRALHYGEQSAHRQVGGLANAHRLVVVPHKTRIGKRT